MRTETETKTLSATAEKARRYKGPMCNSPNMQRMLDDEARAADKSAHNWYLAPGSGSNEHFLIVAGHSVAKIRTKNKRTLDLIEAAPETLAQRDKLLEACKAGLSAILDELGACGKQEIRQHPILSRHARIATQLEAVIAKAEGK